MHVHLGYQFICLEEEFGLTFFYGQTDRQGDSYMLPKFGLFGCIKYNFVLTALQQPLY